MELQFQEYNISEQHIYQIKYVYEELKKMSLDKLWYDISVDDECVFFYGEKKDVKFFFNIFYDENEALVPFPLQRLRRSPTLGIGGRKGTWHP